jgi:hypothetical protein
MGWRGSALPIPSGRRALRRSGPPRPGTDRPTGAQQGHGHGHYAIAELLTAQGIPSPAGYDRARNPHRPGRAWAKSAVRAILRNPRYTGTRCVGTPTPRRGTPRRQRRRRGPCLPHALERPVPLGLVCPSHPSAAGQPGYLPGGPGPHRHPIPSQQPHPPGNATALSAPRTALLRALPAAPARPVDPRRGLLPLPLPCRVRHRLRLRASQVRLPTRGRPGRPSCSSGSPRSPPLEPPPKPNSGTRARPMMGSRPSKSEHSWSKLVDWLRPSTAATRRYAPGSTRNSASTASMIPTRHTVHVQVELGRRIGRVGGGP